MAGRIMEGAYPPQKIDILNDKLDDLALLVAYWERNRKRSCTPVHVRTAIICLAREITAHDEELSEDA